MAATIDPSVKVRPSKSMLAFLEGLKDRDDIPKTLRSSNSQSELDVADVRWVYDNRSEKGEGRRFHELLSECEVVLPSPVLPPRNPKLEARVQRLKAEQEDREYRAMVVGIDRATTIGGGGPGSVEEPISKQLKELNNHLILVFQVVVSVLTAFAFGYFTPYLVFGVAAIDTRLITGILFAFAVGIADLYFVIRYFLRLDGVFPFDEGSEKKSM